MAAGLCVLCNLDVSDEDHRREIDCPSKSCPGRVYHEDCISTYLKRTKYSKDRCTGFPCPAILSTGKQCPGYVCKMHTYFPTNQKKKQARLEAAKAAAVIPKPRPIPIQHKTGAQAAINAMKRAMPDGALEPALPKARRPIVEISNLGFIEGSDAPRPQQPRIIPGFSGPIQDLSGREALRAQVAKLRAEARAPAGGGKGAVHGGGQAKIGGAGGRPRSGGASDSDETRDRLPCPANMWDVFANSSGFGGNLNYFDLEHHNKFSGGQFSSLLQKRLRGEPTRTSAAAGALTASDCTSSECDSVATASTPRDVDESGLQPGLSGATCVAAQSLHAEDFPLLPHTPAVNAPQQLISSIMACDDQDAIGLASDTAMNMLHLPDQDADPVVEYDMVYGTDDGSYLMLDAVSNAYLSLMDAYGEAAELVDCCGEDGNVYMCVAVRKSQLKMRTERQHAWLQALVDGSPQLQQATPAEAAADMPFTNGGSSSMYGHDGSPGATFGGAAATDPSEAMLEDGETDVASLMQLLCV